MSHRVLLAAVVCSVWAAVAWADPDRVFRIDGRAPQQAMISLDDDPVDGPALDTAMGRALAGVLVPLGRPAAAGLGRLVERDTRPRASTEIDARICVVWMYTHSGPDAALADAKRVEIGRTADGWLLAREIDTEEDGLDLARLDETGFARFAEDWPRYRGAVGQAQIDRPGVVRELAGPYIPSRITLDSDTIRRRIFGQAPTIEPLDRVLEDERMFIRLPEGYDPTRPAGMVIWIHAVASGEMPLEVFEPALDELGLICASIENAGNTREMVDRFQLVLDCYETIASRYLIDEGRVYLTGISGGGRSSSMLWGCFPDVFTGAVPIVGLNSYDLAPTGTGKAWPRNYARPRGKSWSLLRTHRLAAITGVNDFNAPEMAVRIDGMKRDGLDVRIVEQENLGHEMPSAEIFAEAIGWVDAAVTTAASEREADARKILDRAIKSDGDARERLLNRVIDDAPWSPSAFEAYELLRSDRGQGG